MTPERPAHVALQVLCPQCDAPPGTPCTLRRYQGPHAVHRERGAAAEPKRPPTIPWPMPELELALPDCDDCGGPINQDRPGVAIASRRAAYVRSRRLAQWRRTHPTSNERVPDDSPLIRWHVKHLTCAGPEVEDAVEYRIATRDLATPRRVLHTALRMMGKPWVSDTDLHRLIAGIMAASALDDPEAVEAARRHASAQRRARTPPPTGAGQ